LKREIDIPNLQLGPCDLCGGRDFRSVLETRRLDGPLLLCDGCGLYFVHLRRAAASRGCRPNACHQVAAEMVRLAGRAKELALVDPTVEENERPWRELTARERVADLLSYVPRGRMLEIGSSTGEMLAAASESFEAHGVEPDERLWQIAISRGLNCLNATLIEARFPDGHFDLAASYHVIEHVPSPAAELKELHRIIRPGGWLVMETPNIANLWYRVLGARWRQFIPDHIFFFTPRTFRRLVEQAGFEVRELRSVGKAMSLRLFLSRLGRYHKPSAHLLESLSESLGVQDRTLRLRLGDVMRIYAQKKIQ
jgi:SAM-dependent methyltransferase